MKLQFGRHAPVLVFACVHPVVVCTFYAIVKLRT
jgi:hypothetical protein